MDLYQADPGSDSKVRTVRCLHFQGRCTLGGQQQLITVCVVSLCQPIILSISRQWDQQSSAQPTPRKCLHTLAGSAWCNQEGASPQQLCTSFISKVRGHWKVRLHRTLPDPGPILQCCMEMSSGLPLQKKKKSILLFHPQVFTRRLPLF